MSAATLSTGVSRMGVWLMRNWSNIKSERCFGPTQLDVTADPKFPTIFRKILTG